MAGFVIKNRVFRSYQCVSKILSLSPIKTIRSLRHPNNSRIRRQLENILKNFKKHPFGELIQVLVRPQTLQGFLSRED